MKPTRLPGRPRLDADEDTVRVDVNLPAYQYDYLAAAAQRDRVSVPEVIRRHLPKPNKRGTK